MGMTPEEQKTFNIMIEQFKELAPNIEIRKQPITSTNELLELENKYKLNTEDVLKVGLGYDWVYEENEPNVKVNGIEIRSSVAQQWKDTFGIFCIHKGDYNLLNNY